MIFNKENVFRVITDSLHDKKVFKYLAKNLSNICFLLNRKSAILGVIIFVILFANFAQSTEKKTLVHLIVTSDVLSDYYKFLGDRSPLEINVYSGKYSRRDVIEVVLLQQALKRGGLDAEIVFLTANTYLRTLEEVISGRAAITANTVWLDDIIKSQQNLLSSPAMIRSGEFHVGIYTSQQNNDVLEVQSTRDLREFSAISNKNWKADWLTLQELGISNIIHTQKWISMVRMVNARRVDFLLAPFQSTPGMVMKIDEITLVPIPGVKVNLVGSRHFAISPKHPHSLKIQQALGLGIQRMRDIGLIKKAYLETGFCTPAVDRLRTLK
ncbi:MAG: hypothetical protein OCC45_07285 [Desulfotalea sp.]